MELGNLSHLLMMDFSNNNLDFHIPPEFEQLVALEHLDLSDNFLGGVIPSELGNIPSLISLRLNYNGLVGYIPSELGNLSLLEQFDVSSNWLIGNIPPEIMNCSHLTPGCSDFRWNGIHTDSVDIRTFINQAQVGNDWESTQTIAPDVLAVTQTGSNWFTLTWEPITYTSDDGAYYIYLSETPGGPYDFVDRTSNKLDTQFTLTGLTPETTYYCVVKSMTFPHNYNMNYVLSEQSTERAATPTLSPVPAVRPISLFIILVSLTYLLTMFSFISASGCQGIDPNGHYSSFRSTKQI